MYANRQQSTSQQHHMYFYRLRLRSHSTESSHTCLEYNSHFIIHVQVDLYVFGIVSVFRILNCIMESSLVGILLSLSTCDDALTISHVISTPDIDVCAMFSDNVCRTDDINHYHLTVALNNLLNLCQMHSAHRKRVRVRRYVDVCSCGCIIQLKTRKREMWIECLKQYIQTCIKKDYYLKQPIRDQQNKTPKGEHYNFSSIRFTAF